MYISQPPQLKGRSGELELSTPTPTPCALIQLYLHMGIDTE